MYARVLKLNFWILRFLHTSEFGFLSVCPSPFLFGWWRLGLWRQLQLHYLLKVAWKRCEWCLFIMENGVLALKQKENIHFGDFCHIKMTLHNRMLQRPFSKLKKHGPTNLYMLYPMVQSVALIFCWKIQENATAMALSTMVIIHRPSSKWKWFWRAGPLKFKCFKNVTFNN